MASQKSKVKEKAVTGISLSPLRKQVNEGGYSPHQVQGFLHRAGPDLKRVVMLSSLGVNRRSDMMLKLRQMHTNLDERHAAEEALIEEAAKLDIAYTIIRTGRLRGGGGEMGLGYQFYDQNKNLLEVGVVGR